MRRFDTPAAPPGWAGQGAELIRIVDPTGRAIAWLAPGFGANCVGYAVRCDDGTWRHILHSGTPHDLRRDPLDYGCAILGPEPNGPGSAHRLPWQFIERDPTAATCAARCDSVRIELNARLEDAALHLELSATNEGNEPMMIALGLRLCLASEFRWDTFRSSLTDQPGTFVGDDLTQRLIVMSEARTEGQWTIDQSLGKRLATEVRHNTAPDALSTPGEQYRCRLVIALEQVLGVEAPRAEALG